MSDEVFVSFISPIFTVDSIVSGRILKNTVDKLDSQQLPELFDLLKA
jgi:hypothetical protein